MDSDVLRLIVGLCGLGLAGQQTAQSAPADESIPDRRLFFSEVPADAIQKLSLHPVDG